MKYSYSWLKQLSGTKLSPQQLASLLMGHSFEVEKVEKVKRNLEGVVIGEILELEKHPRADKLQLVKVSAGKKKLSIVCGAWNIRVKDKVPVATIETKLSNGLEIKVAEIRGEKSEGMLCAPDEIGLGSDHSGILILDPKAKAGESFEKYFNLEDYVLDIDVLSNRGHDALSHIGMAREILALEGKKINPAMRDYDGLKLKVKKTKRLKVEVKDKKLCPRYIGAVMEDVKVQDSPLWLKARLLSCGLRPINNIVDATNYVMLETGQPLHAFDYDIIKGEFPISPPKADPPLVDNFQSRVLGIKSQIQNEKFESVHILVRKAKEGEKIKLLDKTVKKLMSEDLVIADDNKAIALAGVMGGEDSGVTAGTKNIILEAANFNASSIRKSRMRHKLKTDASDRFEKNLDPNLAEKAMVRVIELLRNIGSGSLEGVADVYPKKLKSLSISLNLDYVKSLLGMSVSPSQIIKVLRGLGIEAKNKGANIIVSIPTFRLDLTTQEELIEEIGRIYGYEKIKSVAPVIQVRPSRTNEERIFKRKIKNILVSAGFSEVYNYSFYSQRDAVNSQLGSEKHVELENPMNPEQALLRRSLIPNVLKNIRENLKNFKEFQIFEIGKVYCAEKNILPKEKPMLLGAVVLEKDKNIFHEAKKYLDFIFENLGIEKLSHQVNYKIPEGYDQITLWQNGRKAEIKIGETKEPVGYFGEISRSVLLNFDIRNRVVMFELDMEQLRQAEKIEKIYKPIQKFPKVSRDISMLAGKNSVEFYDIVKIIKKEGKELVLDVNLFDIFEKDKKDSFALHIEFGAQDRTLTSEEVDEAMKKIVFGLDKLGVEVRK